MSGTAALAIVCKTPIPGRSKTRLVPLVGAEASATMSSGFIQDTSCALSAVPAAIGRRLYALYAPRGTEEALRPLLGNPGEDWGMICEDGADFGGVLFNGIAAMLRAGHDCALVVNSDSPTLPPALVTAAVAALRAPGDRLVLGPSTDGGYYLVGLKAPHARLFEEIRWSTPEVMPQTLARAAEIGVPVTLLPTWYDIDDAETFALLEGEMAGHAPPFAVPGAPGAPAPRTRALLADLHARSALKERAP